MNLIPPFIHRRISHRTNLVRIVDNIGWLFFDKILRMGFGLLVGVWVARYLGPDQFGLLNYAVAFTGLFGVIAGFGLQGVVVRDIVRNPEGARIALGTTAVMQLVGGFMSLMLALGCILYMRPHDLQLHSIVAILGSIMLFRASDIVVYWFESQVQSKYTVWVQNGVFLLFAGIKVWLILQQAQLIAFVWAMFSEAVLVSVILLIVLDKSGGPKITSLRASVVKMRELSRESWPLLLSGLAIMIYMKIDQIMLGQMIGDEAVGVFSAAIKISEVWFFIPMAIVATVFPTILESKRRSEAQYYQRLQYLFNLMVWLSVAIALPMTFLSTPITNLLYGTAYKSAGSILAIHIWASVFVFLGVATSNWLLAEGKQISSLQRTLFGAVVNILLNLILIPDFGALGAAWATVIAQFSVGFLYDLFQRETRRIFFMKLRAFDPRQLKFMFNEL